MIIVAYLVVASLIGAVLIRFRLLSLGGGLFLVALPLVFYLEPLAEGSNLAPIGTYYRTPPLSETPAATLLEQSPIEGPLTDTHSKIFPWRKALTYSIAQHHWPLWNPFILSGDILASAAESAVYDPVVLLGLALGPARGLSFELLLRAFLCALFTTLYLRDRGAGELAALVGGVAFSLCDFVSFWRQVPLGWTAALLPLILLSLRRLEREPSWKNTLILTLGLSWMVLAGHPETWVHVALIGGLFLIVGSGEPRSRLIQRLPLPAVSAVLAFGLTAFFLLPFIEATHETAEYQLRSSWHDQSLPLAQSLSFLRVAVVPYVFGITGIESPAGAGREALPASIYVGSVAIALALFGAFTTRRRDRILMITLVVVGTLAGVKFIGVIEVLAALPLLDLVLHERLFFVAAFALSVLACDGVDSIADRRDKSALSTACWFVFLVHSAALLVFLPEMRREGLTLMFVLERSGMFLVPLILVAMLLSRASKPQLLLLAVLVAQRSVEMGTYLNGTSPTLVPSPATVEGLVPEREGPSRIIGTGYNLVPNSSTFLEWEDVRGYTPLSNRRYLELRPLWAAINPLWFDRVPALTPFLSFLNVEYAFVARSVGPPPGWRRVENGDSWKLLRNRRVLPRAFVPRTVMLDCDPSTVLQGLQEVEDYSAMVFINGDSIDGSCREQSNSPGTVSVSTDGIHYQLESDFEHQGWIALSVTHWKGWQAWSERERLDVAFLNYAFVAVKAPAGSAKISVRFVPRGFRVGRVLSGVTAALVVAFSLLWLFVRSSGSRG